MSNMFRAERFHTGVRTVPSSREQLSVRLGAHLPFRPWGGSQPGPLHPVRFLEASEFATSGLQRYYYYFFEEGCGRVW